MKRTFWNYRYDYIKEIPGGYVLWIMISGMYSILRKILVSKMANVSAGF